MKQETVIERLVLDEKESSEAETEKSRFNNFLYSKKARLGQRILQLYKKITSRGIVAPTPYCDWGKPHKFAFRAEVQDFRNIINRYNRAVLRLGILSPIRNSHSSRTYGGGNVVKILYFNNIAKDN